MTKEEIFELKKDTLTEFSINLYTFIKLNNLGLCDLQLNDITNTIKEGLAVQLNLIKDRDKSDE